VRNILTLGICMFFATNVFASVNVNSELSHAAGGAAIAGIVTAIANKDGSEHRAMIGFAVSTVGVVIAEGVQIAGGEKFSNSLQDMVSHAIGAALGSYVTDRFILMPVVKLDHSGSTYIGIGARHIF
jgi:hypothetical protein